MSGSPDTTPVPPRRHPRWIRWAVAALLAALAFVIVRPPRHPASLIPRHLGVAAPPDVRVVHAFTDRWYAAEPTWCLHLAGPSNQIAQIAREAGFTPSGAPPSGVGIQQPEWWAPTLARDRWMEFTRDHSHPRKLHLVEKLFVHESGGELVYRGFDP